MAPLKARDDEGNGSGVEQTPASVGDVDASLGVVGRVSHHLKEDARVVAEQSVAGELSEEPDENGDEKATSHALRRQDLHPRLLGDFHLGLDSLADLGYLSLDEERIAITLGVVFHKNRSGLVIPVLRDEVTGRLGQQTTYHSQHDTQDGRHEEDRQDLQDGGDLQ